MKASASQQLDQAMPTILLVAGIAGLGWGGLKVWRHLKAIPPEPISDALPWLGGGACCILVYFRPEILIWAAIGVMVILVGFLLHKQAQAKALATSANNNAKTAAEESASHAATKSQLSDVVSALQAWAGGLLAIQKDPTTSTEMKNAAKNLTESIKANQANVKDVLTTEKVLQGEFTHL